MGTVILTKVLIHIPTKFWILVVYLIWLSGSAHALYSPKRNTKNQSNQPKPTENGRAEKKEKKEKRKGKKIRGKKGKKEVKHLHKDHPACPAVEAKPMGFLTYQTYQALNIAELQVWGVPQRAGKESRSPQIRMICSTVYSTLFFSLLGLPQALHTENNVQKMSMRLKGKVKLKTLVFWIGWFSWKQLRKHSFLKERVFNLFFSFHLTSIKHTNTANTEAKVA